MNDDADSASGTKSMGCGNSYEKGRCTDGTNVENCVWESLAEAGASSCSGLFIALKIPDDYLCK